MFFVYEKVETQVEAVKTFKCINNIFTHEI
jgi:hypothetical protein